MTHTRPMDYVNTLGRWYKALLRLNWTDFPLYVYSTSVVYFFLNESWGWTDESLIFTYSVWENK